jgi:predicted component of type VI protein secretion system
MNRRTAYLFVALVSMALAPLAGCSSQQSPPPAPPVEIHKTLQQQIQDINNNPGIPPAAKQHAIQQLQAGQGNTGKP